MIHEDSQGVIQTPPTENVGKDVIHVLHVDDEPDQLMITKQFLEEVDPRIQVESVPSPMDAQHILDQQAFDCVISDYLMSGMNGVDFVRRVREQSNTPFILYTGQGSEEVASEAFAAGVDDYLKKESGPIHYRVLAKRVRIAVEKHRAEKAKRESEERYRSLLKGSSALDEAKYQERLEALHGHAFELATANTIEGVAKLTFKAVERVLGFDKGSFSVVKGDILCEIFTEGVDWDEDYELPLNGQGITVRAVRMGRTQLVPDIRLDKDFLAGPAEGVYEPLSELAVPVMIDEEAVAIINVESTELDAFTEEDKRLLEIFSEHVASAIRRLRDLEEYKRYEEKLEALHRHAIELSRATDIMKIAETTFEAIERVLGFNRGSFGIVEENILKFIFLKGFINSEYLELPLDGPGITVRAVKEGEPQLVSDARLDPDFISAEPEDADQSLSELVVPVKIGGEVAAIINVESNELDDFLEEDQKLLETLASHVSSTMERLKYIEMLRASEERFRNLLEESMDAVAVLVGTKFVYANKRQVELIGLQSSSDLIGRDALDFVAAEDREIVKTRALGRQRGEEHPRLYEYKMLRVDGTTIDLEAYVTKIEYEGKPASLALNREITLRKEMENKLLEYAEHLEDMVEERTKELLDAERMVAAGRVASMLGHDLRGPLQNIKSAAYLLRKMPEKAEETIEIIERAADRASRMLEELRYNTREQPLQIVATDLSLIVQRSVEEASPPATIEVILEIGEGLEEVILDPVKIRRVLDNLIGNALEAMSAGGVLKVECGRRGNEAMIVVSDTGFGVKEEDMPKLFKPFHTTKPKGMGLGLAYCKRAVEAHGGKIKVESKEGEGSTFTVALPINAGLKGH